MWEVRMTVSIPLDHVKVWNSMRVSLLRANSVAQGHDLYNNIHVRLCGILQLIIPPHI